MNEKKTISAKMLVLIVAAITVLSVVGCAVVWALNGSTTAPTETTVTTETIMPAITETEPAPTETVVPGETTEPTTAATGETTAATTTIAGPATPTSTSEAATTTKAPTPTPKPATPTPTPTPTEAPTTYLTTRQVEELVWDQVIAARNANGVTTNRSEVLTGFCRWKASLYVVSHHHVNGTYESCASIGEMYNSQPEYRWTYTLHNDGPQLVATLTEAANDLGWDLVVVHNSEMAVLADQTEFGVGVARELSATYGVYEYFVYISCASPDELEWQIENGDYD